MKALVREETRSTLPGLPTLLGLLASVLVAFAWLLHTGARAQAWQLVVFVLFIALAILGFAGLFVVNPNEARVLQLFGRYAGTVREAGLQWDNPFFTKRQISQRVVSFESTKLKVNDADGNPIEIAAIVVYRVVDTALACFAVDNYTAFVRVQSEAALRNMATHYPYDGHDDKHVSLRGNTDEVAAKLRDELSQKVSLAGVEVIEARISHLAYAPEIAHAMLQRQQAAAVIAARQKIVDGAVGMVESALEALAAKKVVELDEERKAHMVSNLLVVLCSERGAQPIVNSGTLYG